MPTFSRHDIENLAFRATDAFDDGGVPLHDSVVKLAKEQSMNPEQIKRLVEATNTNTFLRMFKSKKGNQRMVEFDVADPSLVINEALSAEKKPESSRSTPSISITISTGSPDLFDDVIDENSIHNSLDTSEPLPSEKVASVTEESESLPTLSFHSKLKAKESFLTKIADCSYRAEDLANELANEFKSIYTRSKYSSLELDSLARFGNESIPCLQMVRGRLGLTKISREMSPSEMHYISDRHIIDSGNKDSLEKVGEIIDLIKQFKKYKKGVAYLEGTM